jgi:hypothetical protein
MAKVKGTAIAGRIAFARRRGGDAAVAALLSGLSDRSEAEQLALTGALRSSWYSFPTFLELTEGLDRRFGKGDGELIPEIAGDVAEGDLKTVYKIFFRLASPHFIIGKAAQVWRQYYDSGEMSVCEERPGFARIELRNFETPHRSHCLAVRGWIQRTLLLSGAGNPKVVHPRCRTAGASVCEFLGDWT